MRVFEYQLQTGQRLQFDFTGDEPAKAHVEVDAGQILLTTVIRGRTEQVVIPEGRSWISGTDLRFDLERVVVERDPNGGATEPTVTFDIGPDAGTPGASANITVNQVKQAALTNRSGNLTAGATSEELMAANTARRYLFVHNIDSAEDLWVRFGSSAAAVDGEGSIKIGAGGSIVFEGTFIPTDAVQVIATTINHAWTAYEG